VLGVRDSAAAAGDGRPVLDEEVLRGVLDADREDRPKIDRGVDEVVDFDVDEVVNFDSASDFRDAVATPYESAEGLLLMVPQYTAANGVYCKLTCKLKPAEGLNQAIPWLARRTAGETATSSTRRPTRP